VRGLSLLIIKKRCKLVDLVFTTVFLVFDTDLEGNLNITNKRYPNYQPAVINGFNS
jgi:hypothetical protein